MLTTVKNFLKEEDGVGSVEMILLLLVLVGIVVLFKTNITAIVKDVFSNITKSVSTLKG